VARKAQALKLFLEPPHCQEVSLRLAHFPKARGGIDEARYIFGLPGLLRSHESVIGTLTRAA
jgi:hypothetical protein